MSVNVHVTWSRENQGGLAIKLNRVTMVACLWLGSFAMMAWDTIDSPMGQVGRWALFIGMASSVWTIALLLAHHRSVILEVMSFEHRVMYRDGGGGGSPTEGPEQPNGEDQGNGTSTRRQVVPLQRT